MYHAKKRKTANTVLIVKHILSQTFIYKELAITYPGTLIFRMCIMKYFPKLHSSSN